MIVGQRKPLAEIKNLLGQADRILVVGCGTCVAVCMAGGEKEAGVLASQLRLTYGLEGRKVEVERTTLERQCDREFLALLKRKIGSFDAVVSLACGAGVQFLSETYPESRVLPGLDTTFIGVAEGPGRYVACLENFTADSLGPRRYEEFLLSVYEECFSVLHEAGKIVGCHYDGRTVSCREQIARAPIDLIESLTPPPEGDQTLAEARAAWPDKLFWSNINVGCYDLPPEKLKQVVWERVEQAAPDSRRLAFEISEQYPANWRQSIQVVLDALKETGSD